MSAGAQERQQRIVADTDGMAGTPAAPDGQPQAGTPTSPESTAAAAPAAEQTSTATDERISLDEAKKLRSEAHSLRQRLAAAERRVQEHEDSKLSEQDRLQKRAAELEQQVQQAQAAERTLRTRLAVERQARQMRLVDEDAAYRLLDHDAIEYAEDGEPKNVKPLLEKLAKERPYLVAAEAAAAAEPTRTTAPAAIAATPRADNGRLLSEAALRETEAAARQRVKQLWG